MYHQGRTTGFNGQDRSLFWMEKNLVRSTLFVAVCICGLCVESWEIPRIDCMTCDRSAWGGWPDHSNRSGVVLNDNSFHWLKKPLTNQSFVVGIEKGDNVCVRSLLTTSKTVTSMEEIEAAVQVVVSGFTDITTGIFNWLTWKCQYNCSY